EPAYPVDAANLEGSRKLPSLASGFRRPSRNDGLVVCLLSTQPRQSLWLWAMFPL
ncbi:MAG: hypothetical protein, partial [Olavius algarvensis Gamma 1 endosymbiont]